MNLTAWIVLAVAVVVAFVVGYLVGGTRSKSTHTTPQETGETTPATASAAETPDTAPQPPRRRAAIIYNPTKNEMDTLKSVATTVCRNEGWDEPLFIETTKDDPGTSMAHEAREKGAEVVIAAGDTFRAAAVEQLQVWGQRAGVPVMVAAQGSDPASLAYDAMTRAEAEGADLLLIDTAGRLQNRADLMEELAKIVRVIRKKDPSAPHNTLLVLDATTGQNALSQVETFQKLADVSGLVMTKLDGTARGGVLVALADRFGLPIHAIGVGEQIDDLDAFDARDFARALVGLGE